MLKEHIIIFTDVITIGEIHISPLRNTDDIHIFYLMSMLAHAYDIIIDNYIE